MATEFKHKITTPFAQNGTRTEIPQTSSDGSVSFDQGYTDLYSKKPSEGGKYVGRVPINYLFYLVTAAVKEIQENITNGNIPVNMQQATNILDVQHGGTGVADGFNFINSIDRTQFFNMIGITAGTTQDIIDKLIEKHIIGSFLVNGVGREDWTDVPNMGYFQILIQSFNENMIRMLAYEGRDFGTHIGTINNKQFVGWKRIHNADGSIPYDIGGTPFVYYTAHNFGWEEIVLSDKTTMLKGFGWSNINEPREITLPKKVNRNRSVLVVTGYNNETAHGSFTAEKIYLNDGTQGKQPIGFYFQGIIL